MAFIRWKKNKFGIRQAYLIHSYRDEEGRPKHKTLAYLGREGQITSDQLSLLKERHKGLPVSWDKIEPRSHPPFSDISQLSDTDLVHKLRHLRAERGITLKGMFERLISIGIPEIRAGHRPEQLDYHLYRWLENGWHAQSPHPGFAEAEKLLVPYIRKALEP